MSDYSERSIAIPGSDSAIAFYGGVVLFSVTFSAAGGSDLIFYDNPSAASGTELGVVYHSSNPGTYFIRAQSSTGIYVKNVSGWTGSIGVSN